MRTNNCRTCRPAASEQTVERPATGFRQLLSLCPKWHILASEANVLFGDTTVDGEDGRGKPTSVRIECVSPLAQMVVAAVAAGLPTLTVLISLLINNQRLSDLSRNIDRRIDERFQELSRRIDDTRDLLRSDMLRMEHVMDARLKHLEEHLAR